jgi:hypothetical protein
LLFKRFVNKNIEGYFNYHGRFDLPFGPASPGIQVRGVRTAFPENGLQQVAITPNIEEKVVV